MPSPSPTATRAVKLKRRPPFTTLATRLMATTRSRCGVLSWAAPPRPPSRRFRPPPPRSPRALPPRSPPWPPPWLPPPNCRVRPGIRRSFQSRSSSELQPGFPGRVGQSRDPAVVVVTTAVEHELGDARVLGPRGEQLPDLRVPRLLVAVEGTNVRLEARGPGHGVA